MILLSHSLSTARDECADVSRRVADVSLGADVSRQVSLLADVSRRDEFSRDVPDRGRDVRARRSKDLRKTRGSLGGLLVSAASGVGMTRCAAFEDDGAVKGSPVSIGAVS